MKQSALSIASGLKYTHSVIMKLFQLLCPVVLDIHFTKFASNILSLLIPYSVLFLSFSLIRLIYLMHDTLPSKSFGGRWAELKQ